MSFWCLQFPPKHEQKQVNLRFHSSKVQGPPCLSVQSNIAMTDRNMDAKNSFEGGSEILRS